MLSRDVPAPGWRTEFARADRVGGTAARVHYPKRKSGIAYRVMPDGTKVPLRPPALSARRPARIMDAAEMQRARDYFNAQYVGKAPVKSAVRVMGE